MVRIENRESLSPGGHYGALVFKNISPSRSGVPNVAINQILSSLVFVKKTGGAVYGLELASVEYGNHWLGFETRVTPRFKNPGNVHVVPRGEVRVIDPLGRLTYRGVVNEGSTIILPETFRAYPLKLFAVEKAILPGYYVLELDYRYDGRDEKERWSEQFLYIPPLFWVGLALIGVLIVVFFWRRRRNSLPRSE